MPSGEGIDGITKFSKFTEFLQGQKSNSICLSRPSHSVNLENLVIP